METLKGNKLSSLYLISMMFSDCFSNGYRKSLYCECTDDFFDGLTLSFVISCNYFV